MAGISMNGLSKVYPGGVVAVDRLDLQVEDGEFFALLGPSGCGKTTLLRTIAGLEQSSAGSLSIGGRVVTDLPPGDRNVAMVFQDYALFPHMTVADNIAYPLRIQKVGRTERRGSAEETANGLSLAGLLERRPAELSGGQQQRVALARAIVSRPSVFLFDEPLSNLDARLRLEARTFLKRLQKELGVTTVFVTHDQAEALALADRMAIMEHGRIRQIGSPREVFARPANTFVANFIGSTPMNLLDATVADGSLHLACGTIPVPADVRSLVHEGDTLVVGIRPEYLTMTPGEHDDGLRGTVSVVENLGTYALVTLENEAQTFGVVTGEADEPALGARCSAVPQPGRVLLYGAEDGELITAERTEQQEPAEAAS
ncbi:MAG: ABC transporter ATP-binding protein [Mycobacteriales bacterium]|nr:MAG: ABC transporter [Pseudonocardiales bacterium]